MSTEDLISALYTTLSSLGVWFLLLRRTLYIEDLYGSVNTDLREIAGSI